MFLSHRPCICSRLREGDFAERSSMIGRSASDCNCIRRKSRRISIGSNCESKFVISRPCTATRQILPNFDFSVCRGVLHLRSNNTALTDDRFLMDLLTGFSTVHHIRDNLSTEDAVALFYSCCRSKNRSACICCIFYNSCISFKGISIFLNEVENDMRIKFVITTIRCQTISVNIEMVYFVLRKPCAVNIYNQILVIIIIFGIRT